MKYKDIKWRLEEITQMYREWEYNPKIYQPMDYSQVIKTLENIVIAIQLK